MSKTMHHVFMSLNHRFWIWACIIALLLCYGVCHNLYLLGWPSKDVLIGILDSDVYIRMTKVREFIQDHNIYNHAVIATNTPYGGVDTPWTRPLDFILMLLYQFSPSDMHIEKRLLLVGNWYPLIIMGLIIFSASKAAETGLKSTMRFAVFVLALAGYAIITPTYEYFIPGNTDHHSLQALMWCFTVWCLLAKPTKRSAIGLGMSMGIWTWISPESAVYVFAIFVITGFIAVKKPAYTFFPLIASLSLTLITIIALFIEIPYDQILVAQHYDTLSIVYVTLFSFCSVGFFVLHYWIAQVSCPKYRFKISIGAAFVLALSFLILFPKFIKGPMADVEPYIITNFLTRIWEATPMLSTGPAIYLPNIYLPILALLLSIRFFNKATILLPLMLIALDINLLQLRGYYYLELLSMIVIAKFLPTYIYGIRRKYNLNRFAFNPLGILLGLHLAIAGIVYMLPTSSLMADNRVNTCTSLAFQTIQNGSLVNLMGNKPLNMESNILGNSGIPFFTPYHYVAGFYHREGLGMEVKDKIIESPSLEDIRPLLKDRQINFLFICPSPVKEAWVNQYFNDTTPPQLDWVTINSKLEFPSNHDQTTKPLILMVTP